MTDFQAHKGSADFDFSFSIKTQIYDLLNVQSIFHNLFILLFTWLFIQRKKIKTILMVLATQFIFNNSEIGISFCLTFEYSAVKFLFW